ncbi:MAG: 4Fe-4S dicluster domain-containing protein [Candidatus Thermoplasmatota archaeon]
MKIISKEDFNNFIDELISDEKYDVHGPKEKYGAKNKFVFGPLDSSDQLRLDYDTTILPPKKYFLPQYETMMEFNLDKPLDIKKEKENKKKLLLGIHPYDLIAILQMDNYYLDKEDVSKSYLERRKNTILVGSDVLNVSEKAFFGSMNTGSLNEGYALFLTDLGSKVAIEIGSKEGEKLIKKASRMREAEDFEKQKVKYVRKIANEESGRGLKVHPSEWYNLLEENYDSDVWKKQSDKCLSCGTCTMVCPTCFCYDVNDYVDLNKKGKRVRTWDGCLLRDFTKVASGEIFREDIMDRYRHRFFRKGKYLPDRLGYIACVGCGRCSSQCVPDIADPVKVMNMVFDESDHLIEKKEFNSKSIKLKLDEVDEKKSRNLHKPSPATIKRVKKLTENDTLFEIQLDEGKKLGHDPGQFVELSIAGIGEAPFSVSSAPNGKSFELVIRRIGDVTTALEDMKTGNKIGIRGPLGKGFDVNELKGRDLLFIAGGIGIVPLRSLINYVIDKNNRKDYGEITILYGCKEPCEMLFREEVDEWDKRDDINHRLTVDSCPEGECWDGDIGLITKLIPKVTFDPKNTYSIIVGPPVMYRFCIQLLLDMGVPDENIIVSLERRMKCGVGKCGHCQINNLYVCKDGPVFNYKEIKDLPEAFT